MAAREQTMYVIGYDGGYLRFASYGMAGKVDHPAKATLYSRLADAEYRTGDTARTCYVGYDVSSKRVMPEELHVIEVTLAVVGEKEIN